ncbi:protein YIPF1-like [Pomacea canaliculata]|uniref:protein YIPF1-like n=1 Tax=Pomacea canaliculata TaxID=400727 RepID=UPI000D738196|nr:protein YIPF1-like [Pomacea canaliculata]
MTLNNMAASVSIDVDALGSKPDDGLHFQDIPHNTWSGDGRESEQDGRTQTHSFTNFPHSAADSDDEESDKAELLKDKRTASFWTFEYYQQFFDVETSQVAGRIFGSMFPRPQVNYLEKHIRPNPDLYGPFWICTTLVFTTAIAGNLANYFQTVGTNQWVYDFHKVTWAASAIFAYWWLIPFALLMVLWWRGNPAHYTFLEILCLYGYSLAIYIPISLLWVIQIIWLQWLLVMLGAALSGSVLLLAFWPAVREDVKKVALTIMAIIFILHFALALGFMLCFFYVPSNNMQHSQLVPSNTTVAAVVENSALKLSLVNQSQAQPDSVTDSKPQGTLQESR